MNKNEKNIPNLITDKEYIKNLFKSRLTDIDSQAKHLVFLRSYPIKEHFDNDFFHYVILHNLTIKTKRDLRRRYKIFSASFSGHGRKKMYQLLELAHESKFNDNESVTPQPLWYVDEIMSAFYIGVPGQNLLEHIKNGNLNRDLIKRTARALFKLHQLKPSKEINLEKHKFSLNFLDPTDVIEREHNKRDNLAHQIKSQFKLLKHISKQINSNKSHLSHGDFHPENVIVNEFKTKQIAIIDFSESCLAPIYYDIASFLQQLQFMTKSYITPSQYYHAEKMFLDAYFNEVDISPEVKSSINLYKSWTALKSAVYFIIFKDKDNRNFAAYLLKKSKQFSDNIH